MNWVHCVSIPVVASLPYLPKVGPAPLRFAEPPATNATAQVLPPTPLPVAIEYAAPSVPEPYTFTVPDWLLPAAASASNAIVTATALVETTAPPVTVSSRTTAEQGVTPEMFVELFRQIAGRNTNQSSVVGVPLYFAPPPIASPRQSSTATYRSE
jgi:hypothetical protein